LLDASHHVITQCVELLLVDVYRRRDQVALLFVGVGVQHRDE